MNVSLTIFWVPGWSIYLAAACSCYCRNLTPQPWRTNAKNCKQKEILRSLRWILSVFDQSQEKLLTQVWRLLGRLRRYCRWHLNNCGYTNRNWTVFFFPVCMCTCIYFFVCLCICVGVCAYVWKPEAYVMCLPKSYSTLLFLRASYGA